MMARFNRLPPRTSINVVREFFDLLDKHGVSYKDLEQRSGTSFVTISKWRHGKHSPYVVDFEAAVESIGYRLALVPIDKA